MAVFLVLHFFTSVFIDSILRRCISPGLLAGILLYGLLLDSHWDKVSEVSREGEATRHHQEKNFKMTARRFQGGTHFHPGPRSVATHPPTSDDKIVTLTRERLTDRPTL